MTKLIALSILILVLSGCNQSASKNADTFDPCDAVRQVDPHCGWKPHWTDAGPSVSDIDGTKTEFLELDSSDPDGMTSGHITYGVLRVCFKNGRLCGGDSVGVGVTVDGIVQPKFEENTNTSVRVRFDDDKPARLTWGIADSHDALFPYGREKQFLGQLERHNILILEFSYYEQSPRTLKFELSGLANKIKSIGAADN